MPNNAAFKRRLAKVPEQMRRQINAALKKNAEEWVGLAKQLVPRDPVDGTPLADSIRNYTTETGGQVVRAGGAATTKRSAAKRGGILAAVIGDGSREYDYALAQEFGTQEHGAQPFFWPSYRTLKKRMDRRRKAAVRQAAKEFSGG